MKKPCLDCGVPSDGPRCPDHHAERERKREQMFPKGSATSRGYDYAWTKVSRQARREQPFCSIPGCNDTDLTTDHSAEAWEAHDNGKPITLDMVRVLCRSHNGAFGDPRKSKGVGGDPQARGAGPTAVANLRITHRGSSPREVSGQH